MEEGQGGDWYGDKDMLSWQCGQCWGLTGMGSVGVHAVIMPSSTASHTAGMSQKTPMSFVDSRNCLPFLTM